MKRSAVWAAAVLMTTIFSRPAAAQRTEPASRTFQFKYRTVVKEIPAGAGKVEVWLPYPTSDAHQTIDQVTIDAPRPVTISREPEYGNQILYVRVDNPTERQIPIELTFTATRKEYVNRPISAESTRRARPLTPEQRTRFLQPDRLVPIDGRIRQL